MAYSIIACSFITIVFLNIIWLCQASISKDRMQAFLVYITIHTLKSYIMTPSARTALVPTGFIMLIMSQYSFIFLSDSHPAIWAGYAFRFAGLVFFLIIAFYNFYASKEYIK
jgi:hypothetical protein